MGVEQIVGRKLSFGVSEPWDFGEKCGTGPFTAIAEAVVKDMLLLRLSEPIEYEGLKIEFLVATARHRGESLENLVSGSTIAIDLTPVARNVVLQPHEAEKLGIEPGSPFHAAASWRGWGLTGGVSLL